VGKPSIEDNGGSRLQGTYKMSNSIDQEPFKKPSKLERERMMYEKLGMQHPKDAVLDFGLRFFKRMAERSKLSAASRDAQT
jgi:hypothetical protein